MGNQCCSSSSNKLYQRQFNELNMHELRSQWSIINKYKIKRIFQRFADSQGNQHEERLYETHRYKEKYQKNKLEKLSIYKLDKFCQMFPQFNRYEQMQKQRIYEIFDRSNNGYITWNDFYDTISVCYYGPEKILSVIMFMIFDQLLQKQLNSQQLTLLVDLNAIYLKDNGVNESQQQIEPEYVVQNLLKDKQNISLQQWIQNGSKYFDFNQFRRTFNIFKQQKLQKQLVQNFSEWNQLFDEKQGKYVSYILSFKWFQTWKFYVENQYGIYFNIQQKNPATMKSIKTKKSLKTNNSNKNKRHYQPYNTIRKIKIEDTSICQQNEMLNTSSGPKSKITINNEIRNYDMIRSIIGERPKQIYNRLLEGQYEGTIKPGVVQNRDYVYVSQKVWSYFTQIYSGWPEFRRTGFDQIDLYPKIIRVYSGMFKNQINYASQIVREVSNSRTIEDILKISLQITSDQLQNITIFYRTIGMPFWQQIKNRNDYLIQLTPNTIILLVYLQKNSNEQRQFIAKYRSTPKNIKQAVLGDILIYDDPVNKVEKQVVFFNRNLQGKYIIHFLGESYVNDLCLSQRQFYKFCKLNYIPQNNITVNANTLSQNKIKTQKIEKRRRGIEGIRNLSFFNSLILQLIQNSKFKQLFQSLSGTQLYDDQSKGKKYLTVILAYISKLIKANMRVDPRDILFIVQSMFPGFKNFDTSLINAFIIAFFDKIQQQAEILNIKNITKSQYEFDIHDKKLCSKCGNIEEQNQENNIVLNVKIPEQTQNYYQIIFVPFCLSMSSSSLKRYGFELKKNSTFRDYKNKFIQVANLGDRNFIFLEIQGHKIIKNYNNIKQQNKTLQQLHLRQDDNIFAFQLCTNFSVFVKNHFSFSEADNFEIQQKDLKVGDMIDCKSLEKGWIFGKIIDKQIMPYTYQQNLKVLHKFTHNDQNQYNYKVEKNVIAFFPSYSYKNCEQFHLKLVQRVFSEANNTMINCNLPLIIALPSWMRPKQFQYLVYMQIQRFIAPNYIFTDQNNVTSFIGSSTIQKNILRQATKIKVKKFKQYLYGKNLPYKLCYIDNSGYCLVCYKFVKSVIYKGEFQNYCYGCPISNDIPISWQIMVNDLTIAIDWKNPWAYRKDVVKNDSTYLNSSSKKKKDIETIQSCLEKTFNQYDQVNQMLCCNVPVKNQTKKVILNPPSFLILSLQRVVEENGFKRKIKKPVYFGDDDINIQGQVYKLIGVIASKGYQANICYTTYIKESKENQKSRWLAYNGQRVQIIRKQQIDKKCTLLFFYEKQKQLKKQKPKRKNLTIMPKIQIQQNEQQDQVTNLQITQALEKDNSSNKLNKQNDQLENENCDDILNLQPDSNLNVGLLKISDEEFAFQQK